MSINHCQLIIIIMVNNFVVAILITSIAIIAKLIYNEYIDKANSFTTETLFGALSNRCICFFKRGLPSFHFYQLKSSDQQCQIKDHLQACLCVCLLVIQAMETVTVILDCQETASGTTWWLIRWLGWYIKRCFLSWYIWS